MAAGKDTALIQDGLDHQEDGPDQHSHDQECSHHGKNLFPEGYGAALHTAADLLLFKFHQDQAHSHDGCPQKRIGKVSKKVIVIRTKTGISVDVKERHLRFVFSQSQRVFAGLFQLHSAGKADPDLIEQVGDLRLRVISRIGTGIGNTLHTGLPLAQFFLRAFRDDQNVFHVSVVQFFLHHLRIVLYLHYLLIPLHQRL